MVGVAAVDPQVAQRRAALPNSERSERRAAKRRATGSRARTEPQDAAFGPPMRQSAARSVATGGAVAATLPSHITQTPQAAA